MGPGGPEVPRDLAIVIPARDAAGTLAAQLEALQAQRGGVPVEVVVVDDASQDDTAEIAHRFGDVRVVRGSGSGPAAARNRGAQATGARLLCFVDADDVVGDGWLSAMRSALGRSPVVTGPLDLDRLNSPDVVQARAGAWTRQLDRFEGGFSYVNGCNFGIRREVLEAVGGFDEGLAVGEDLELSLRLAAQGVEVVHDARAVVHYRLRHGTSASVRQAWAYGRAAAEVARRARELGFPTDDWRAPARRLLRVAMQVSSLSTSAGRLRWWWLGALSAGRLWGEIAADPIAAFTRRRG